MTEFCIERTLGAADIIGEHEWVEYEVRARIRHRAPSTSTVLYTWRCVRCGETKKTEVLLSDARGRRLEKESLPVVEG